MSTLVGDICLDDIPRELIRVGRNGKRYLSIKVGEMRAVDDWGFTHYIKTDWYDRDGRSKDPNVFIGKMKPLERRQVQSVLQGARETATHHEQEQDDLPF